MISGKVMLYSLVRRNGMFMEMQTVNGLLLNGFMRKKELMMFSTIKKSTLSNDKKPLSDPKYK